MADASRRGDQNDVTAKEFAKIQKQLELTDIGLAEQLDVNRSTVWGWRTGEKKIEKLTELAMLHLQSSASPALPPKR